MVINISISAVFQKSPISFWIGPFDSQTSSILESNS